MTQAERFEKYVVRTDGCWLWRGFRNRAGYGKLWSGITVNGKQNDKRYAHRVSYELHRGPIPPGMCVLHHCDTPSCVRPDHLFLGTHADNVHDKMRKGRGNTGDRNGSRTHPEAFPRGSQVAQAKLTESDVTAILERHASGCSGAALAREYGVSASAIHHILHGVTWKHVPRVSHATGTS